MVKAQLWDTSGGEKYRAIASAHYRKALGCLIVYDVTRRDTFENVKYWIQQLLDLAEQDTCITLVGNKIDLVEDNPAEREVTYEEGMRFAASYNNMVFTETSSKKNTKVQSAFQDLLANIYEGQKFKPAVSARQALKIHTGLVSTTPDNTAMCSCCNTQ